MTFKERFLRGDCNMEVIHDWVAFWHDGIADGQGLQEFLGLTNEEYREWLGGGPEGLAEAIRKDTQAQYKAVCLTWPELADQLQSLVQQILGMACEVSTMQLEFCYWEMRIDFVAHIDEALSAKICERLELQGVKSDRFVNHCSVYEDQILRLLGKLTGYEVSSSHADDNGVWIICKEHRASGREHTRSERLQPNIALPSIKTIQAALQCLTDNGIAADEAETVLQALGYILFDTEIM